MNGAFLRSFEFKIGLILALAFSLRVVGINFGLPYIYHQDEPIIVNHALAAAAQSYNPGFFIIPPFTMYCLLYLYGIYYAIGLFFGWFANQTDFAVSFLKDPTVFYLIGRLSVGAVFGTVTVATLGKLGRDFFGARTGLLAGFFLAVCFAHALHSHYIYADIAVTMLLTLMNYWVLKGLRDGKNSSALLAGAFFGLAVSAKYTAVYFLPVVILANFFIFGRPSGIIQRTRRIGLAALAAAAAYFIAAPFTLFDWPNFYAQMHAQTNAEGGVGLFHHLTYSLANGGGWPLLCLGLIGFFVLAKKCRGDAVYLGGSAIFYYLVNCFFSQTFARYMLPLVPILCLLGAFGFDRIMDLLDSRKWLMTTFVVLIFAGMALPTLYADWLFLSTDTRDLANRWIDQNCPAGARIVVDNRFYAPHLCQTPEQIKQKYQLPEAIDPTKRKRLDLMMRISQTNKTFEVYTLDWSQGANVSGFMFQKPFVKLGTKEWDDLHPDYLIVNYSEVRAPIHEAIRRNPDRFKLMASFSPFWNAKRRFMIDRHSSAAAPDSQEDLFSRHCLGPYLEVYKLVKGAL